jgi:hypothetical protein
MVVGEPAIRERSIRPINASSSRCAKVAAGGSFIVSTAT